MAELAAGGGGLVEVHRGALRQAAEQASGVSGAIGKLAGDVGTACSPAAAAHSGWRFGKALAGLVPVWEGHLHGQSSAVSAASGKLSSSQARYSAAEEHLVASAQAALG